jgi:hypothetical protein
MVFHIPKECLIMLNRAVILVSSLFISASIFAQTPQSVSSTLPDSATGNIVRLDSLIAEALRNNPQLRAAAHQTSAAEARVSQVTSWNPPELGVDLFQTPISSFPNPFKDGL